MRFFLEYKHATKVLRQQKKFGAKKLFNVFPNKDWTLNASKTLLRKNDACKIIN